MNSVKLSQYAIPAREIAESMWGTGGTLAYHTNRKGAYYFSCSGHGGYVVKGASLTDSERKDIDRYILPRMLQLAVQRTPDGDMVRGYSLGDFRGQPRSVKYNPRDGPISWVDMPVYLFEEDCAWVILEKFTGIHSDVLKHDETIAREIERIFQQYYSKRTAPGYT
jgi:hypothetical protein